MGRGLAILYSLVKDEPFKSELVDIIAISFDKLYLTKNSQQNSLLY
jgi:hypothetical protein